MAKWIQTKEDWGDVCPVFTKKFPIQKPVRKAELMASALGVYEARLNGVRVGDFVMAPGWTVYHKRVQYQVYDITEMLRADNTLNITLGKGWYAGRLGWEKKVVDWSDRAALIAEVRVAYTDGETEVIASDQSWQAAQSPVRFSEIYDGEIYDAGFVAEHSEDAAVLEGAKNVLIPTEGEIIREISEIRPVSLFTTPKGETVIDFGQNLTGYVRFRINANKGEVVSISHAEVLDKDGNFYTTNLRSAKQIITYICGGQDEEYNPRLSFQGFRYIRLDRFPRPVRMEDFVAVVVHSNIKRTGHFTSSNTTLNKLYQNIIWGQKGNFLDVPTDCPQRDERLGWTGDAQVFVRTATYNFDVERFFTKWLHDMAADQRPDGSIPHVVPNILGGEGSSAAWGDACTICPWQVYLTYGNPAILRDQFDCMQKWVEYIRSQGDNEFLWNTGDHFADWLGLDSEPGSYKGITDQYLIATAYYAYSTSLLVKAGKVLGKDMSAYENLYTNIVAAFRDTFIVDGKLTSPTQTAHALTLYFHLAQDEAAIARALADLVVDNGCKLSTGFVGTPYLLHALSDHGYADLAYKLLLRDEYPSWLFPIKMGATTMWEHWDGIKPDGEMWSPDMNSFNHYAYGAVADWMFGVMAGINVCEDHPGFKHILFKPIPGSGIDSVKASIETRQGMVQSEWERVDERIRYSFTVPEGATATVVLPGETKEVAAGVHVFEQ